LKAAIEEEAIYESTAGGAAGATSDAVAPSDSS